MQKAKLYFTNYKNSFAVHIPNLETLNVEQIRELQHFVSTRNGLFDFESYSFVIQKRLEFYEFVKLIKESGISAECIDKPKVFERKKQIGFGQYKGVFYEDLPDSYMLWLKANYRGQEREIIDKELGKRGL